MFFLSIRIRVHCGGPPFPVMWPSGLRIHSCFGLPASPLFVLLLLLIVFVVVAYSFIPLCVLPLCVAPLCLHGARYFPALAMANFVSPVVWVFFSVAHVASASLLIVSAICCSIASARRDCSISACSVARLATTIAATCCFLCFFCARFLICACSSYSVAGNSRCLASCPF